MLAWGGRLFFSYPVSVSVCEFLCRKGHGLGLCHGGVELQIDLIPLDHTRDELTLYHEDKTGRGVAWRGVSIDEW
jgi:hypothetical protein